MKCELIFTYFFVSDHELIQVVDFNLLSYKRFLFLSEISRDKDKFPV